MQTGVVFCKIHGDSDDDVDGSVRILHLGDEVFFADTTYSSVCLPCGGGCGDGNTHKQSRECANGEPRQCVPCPFDTSLQSLVCDAHVDPVTVPPPTTAEAEGTPMPFTTAADDNPDGPDSSTPSPVCTCGTFLSESGSDGACTECSAGTYCPCTDGTGQGALSSAASLLCGNLTECPQGSYCPVASCQPIACPPHSNTESAGMSLLSSCKCDANYFKKSVTGGIGWQCQSCGAFSTGPAFNNGGITTCSCIENAYKDLSTGLCTACPTHSSTQGLTDRTRYSECICNNGFYKIEQTEEGVPFECARCPINHFCSGGEKFACEPDVDTDTGPTLSSPQGSSRRDDCICKAGFYRPPAFDPMTQFFCQPCPENAFCPGGEGVAIACPDDSVRTNMRGADAFTGCTCPAGTFMNDDFTACTVCTTGFFCSDNVQHPCANDMLTNGA
eukprot:318808-Rhodomonas_salina.1